jgi:phosphocarrier protein
VTGPSDGRGEERVVGTSIMGLMMLAAGPGQSILIEAAGPQAEDALNALTSLVENKFEED